MNILLLNVERESVKLRRMVLEEILNNLAEIKLGNLGIIEWESGVLDELNRIDKYLKDL